MARNTEATSARKRKAKPTEEVTESAPKKKKAAREKPASTFNPYGKDVNAVLDNIEKSVGLSESTLNTNEGRMSTGYLMLDIVLGGGITAGWYTNFGHEQSCKSTGANTLLLSGVKHEVPFLSMFDYEGSSEPNYLETLMRNMGLPGTIRDVFGEKDRAGAWVIPPRVRYRSEAVAEKFFDFLAQLERRLPDKRLMGGSWYYIYDGNKANKAIVGDRYDKTYYQKTGKYRVEAEDGSLQALVVVDSYPAMLPERLDVDDPGAGMAAQARMFSEQLKRVKGKMRGKRIAVIGINQLRDRPGVSFGNPEYEPGGRALQLFSDVRLKFTSRAVSGVPEARGKGQIEEEDSVQYNGVDKYRYIQVRAIKNKLSVPYLECWMRLWITDAKSIAQGFDPVWDTYQYLKETGQLVGKRTSMTLKLVSNPAEKAITWSQFKQLVLGDKATIRDICEKMKCKPMMIRTQCFKQMASGRGLDLFFEQQRKSAVGAKEKAEASSDDDDDE